MELSFKGFIVIHHLIILPYSRGQGSLSSTTLLFVLHSHPKPPPAIHMMGKDDSDPYRGMDKECWTVVESCNAVTQAFLRVGALSCSGTDAITRPLHTVL